MTSKIVALLGGLVLLLPGAATAAGGTVRTYAGITCNWSSRSHDGSVVCRRSNGTGLAVAVAIRFVGVTTYRTGKVLFFRNQPTHSPGFGPLNDKRVFHSEAHRGIVCYWSRTGGGTVLCNRSDRHGYVAGVSHFQALVINENNKVVYLRNQP